MSRGPLGCPRVFRLSLGDSQECKGISWMRGVASEGCCNIGVRRQAEQADGQVAYGRHDLGCRSTTHLAAVLVKGDIPHPMQPILDAPVPPPEGEELLRAGAVRVQARDGVGYFLAGLAFAGDYPFHSADLSQVRPIAVPYQVCRCPQLPFLPPVPAAACLHRLGRWQRSQVPQVRNVLPQRGLIFLYDPEVVPPFATTRRESSRWAN